MADDGSRRRLGRGLAALIGDAGGESPPDRRSLRRIPVAMLRPNPRNPRKTFDDADLADLAASIRERGVVQAILVRPAGDGYEIIAGSTHTIAAPAGLPDDIATKIADCITAIATDETYLDDATTRSLPVNYMSAEETQAFVEEQHDILQALWDEQPWFDN